MIDRQYARWAGASADAGAARAGAGRSREDLPAVVNEVDGVPIHAFGRTFVYGVAPDFETGVVLQEGNDRAQVKIQPGKSWELDENRLGSMVSWQPRTPQNDVQPFLAINLIDGDPDTCWCSRGEGQPDVEPAWIRLDLVREEALREIVLVPRRDGQGVPQELAVQVSRDGWHWTTVHEGASPAALRPGEPLRIPLTQAAPVKQIRIVGNRLPLVSWSGFAEHFFVLAEVQALDERGENVALARRGTGVTVSSTNYGHGSTWEVYDQLWPIQYDLGAKWVRLSGSNPPYHHDTLQWRFVEQEKGKYVVDPRTEQAIDEAAANGCQVLVILCYGNWLYTHEPAKESLDIRRFPSPFPPGPVTREAFEGYKNWVRFMVTHFRGRVAWWEIYNEPIGFGFEVVKDYAERVKVYCDLVKEVVPIIREADPAAKISLAGMAGVPGITQPPWLHDCLKHDLARLVDAIGWHTQGTVHPEYPENWRSYPRHIREFQRLAEEHGFKGLWMVTEAWWGAPYPPHTEWGHPPHRREPGKFLTEIRKAKDMARMFVANQGLDAISFWCNTWFDQGQNDGGLFRNTFAADPLPSTQPEAAYYVMRTLCTVFAGVQPAELDVSFSASAGELDHYAFALADGGRMVGVWLPGESVDRHPGVTTDVTVNAFSCRRVVAVDTLNGFEQELAFERRRDQVIIPRVLVRDYPLLLRLEGVADSAER